MIKWIVLVLALVVAGAFFMWRRDAVKISYVNGLAAYTALPGKEYILERDCYIFKFKDHQPDWPFLAANVTVPELPATVDEKLVGTDQPKVALLDIARTGSHFKIVSVRRDERRGRTTITLEVLFTNENERKYARVDLFWMLDHQPEEHGLAPRILDAYAVERTGI